MSDLEASQQAWLFGRHTHPGDADAPPARLERTPRTNDWDGDPFEEWTEPEDDWLYDDPYFDSVPEEDLTDIFDSREVDLARS